MKRLQKTYQTSLCGKTVAVSGATGGLGQELCTYLARLGADLVLIDRNMEKSHALADRLRAEYPGVSISHVQMDLSDFGSVVRGVGELKQYPLHALYLNAGAYSIPRHTTDLGYDNVYQINFLAPYFLARELGADLAARGGRVIAVGSIAQGYSTYDPQDIDFSGRSRASRVYGNAKRYLAVGILSLRKHVPVPVALVHPGITCTGITAHYPKWLYAIIRYPMKVIFMPPRKAALSLLVGTWEDCREREWIGPRVFDVWGRPKKKPHKAIGEAEWTHMEALIEGLYQEMKIKQASLEEKL